MLRPKPTMISLSMKDVTEHLESIDRKAAKARAEGIVSYSSMRHPLTDLPTASSPSPIVSLEAPTVLYLSDRNYDRDPRIQGITPVPITTDMLHTLDLPSRTRDSAQPTDPFAVGRSIEPPSLAESQSENTRTITTASASSSTTQGIDTPDSAHQDSGSHSPGFLESEHSYNSGDPDFLAEDQDSIMTETPGPGGSPMPRVPRASVDYNDFQYSSRISRDSSLGKPLPEDPAIGNWEDVVCSSPVQDDYHQYLRNTTSARAHENARAHTPTSHAMDPLLNQRFSQLQLASAQLPHMRHQRRQGTRPYPLQPSWPQSVDSVPGASAKRPLPRTSRPLFQTFISPCPSEESYMRESSSASDEGAPILRDNPHLRYIEVVAVSPNTLHRRRSHHGLMEWADDIYLTPRELAMAQGRRDQGRSAQTEVASAPALKIRRQRPRQTMVVIPMERNIEYPEAIELSTTPNPNVTPRSRQRSRRYEQRIASAQRPPAMDRQLSENVVPRTTECGQDSFLSKRFKSSKQHDLK